MGQRIFFGFMVLCVIWQSFGHDPLFKLSLRTVSICFQLPQSLDQNFVVPKKKNNQRKRMVS